jgi:GDP-D-mannose 3',5'-epimerase
MVQPERVLVAGGAGFIGSHMSVFLRNMGYWVRCVDWADNEFMRPEAFCDEFLPLDLRVYENCHAATATVDWVFNFAADTGGIGFTHRARPEILYNNLMISSNMLEAARRNGVKRFFYSSSACVYPEHLQVDTDVVALKEETAWQAVPLNAYGLEKIVTEEMCRHYMADFGMETRVARLHNIYGPWGTWRGGRERAPAALIRKAIVATNQLQIWGNDQKRSFTFINDCVEGIWRLFQSDYSKPVNIGSHEPIAIRKLAKLALKLAGHPKLPIIPTLGPDGVQGRSSDNVLINEVLGWAPTTPLRVGMHTTYEWISQQIALARQNGEDVSKFAESPLPKQDVPELGQLRSTRN